MRILLKLLFSLSIICGSYAAQSSETVLIAKKLHWTDNSDASKSADRTLHFLNSADDNHFGGLPYVVHRQALRSFGEVTNITWKTVETTGIASGFFSQTQLLEILANYRVEAEISDGGGTPYLVVLVLPIRQVNKGVLERLLSFELEVSIENRPQLKPRSLQFASSSV